MSVTITTLAENTVARPDIIAEWGFSAFVEVDGLSILLDAGPETSVVHNAGVLGIDLRKIDHIVLSHGHFDHTGGLPDVLRVMRKNIEIIAHPDIWAEKYSKQIDGSYRYIGPPFPKPVLESRGATFTLSRDPVRITDNVMTTGEVPQVTEFEEIEPGRFWVKEDGEYKPDPLADDLALVINTPPGLIVIMGCGHRGAINTLQYARRMTRRKEIRLVLGGCHLIGASALQIAMTIGLLKEMDVQRIGVSHCTGLAAAAAMQHELGDRFFFNNAGTRLTLE